MVIGDGGSALPLLAIAVCKPNWLISSLATPASVTTSEFGVETHHRMI